MATVSVYSTPDYSHETLKAAVEGHFASLGLEQDLHTQSKVLIKPNLITNRRPGDAVTTNPALLCAVIEQLQSMGVADITVADSPGGPFTHAQLSRVYAATGMEEVAQRYGVKLGYDTAFTVVENPSGELCRSFEIIPAVTQADVIINMPKLKSHGMTMMSAAVKNLFGCVPGLLKPELHFRYPEKPHFGTMLVDLSLLVRPAFTIMDAVEGMEGDGPTGGEKRYMGLTFASRDLYDLDLLLCQFLGFSPQEVPTVADSLRRGLCSADASDITLTGQPEAFVPLSDFKRPRSSSLDFSHHVPAFLQKPVQWFGERFLRPRPVIVTKKCIGCGRCAESCPPHTIAMQDKKAVIDYSNCIKCYCCHEMCPAKAIDIKRPGLLRL